MASVDVRNNLEFLLDILFWDKMFSTVCGYGNILCSISIFCKFLYHFETVCPIARHLL